METKANKPLYDMEKYNKVYEYCRSHGGKLLGIVDDVYTVRCHNNHVWKALYGDFTKRIWCNKCGKENRRYMYLYTYLRSLGYTLITEYFEDPNAKLTVQCPFGHQWETVGRKLRRGYLCPTCGDNRIHNAKTKVRFSREAPKINITPGKVCKALQCDISVEFFKTNVVKYKGNPDAIIKIIRDINKYMHKHNIFHIPSVIVASAIYIFGIKQRLRWSQQDIARECKTNAKSMRILLKRLNVSQPANRFKYDIDVNNLEEENKNEQSSSENHD